MPSSPSSSSSPLAAEWRGPIPNQRIGHCWGANYIVFNTMLCPGLTEARRDMQRSSHPQTVDVSSSDLPSLLADDDRGLAGAASSVTVAMSLGVSNAFSGDHCVELERGANTSLRQSSWCRDATPRRTWLGELGHAASCSTPCFFPINHGRQREPLGLPARGWGDCAVEPPADGRSLGIGRTAAGRKGMAASEQGPWQKPDGDSTLFIDWGSVTRRRHLHLCFTTDGRVERSRQQMQQMGSDSTAGYAGS